MPANNTIILGLTGGVGCGKSEAAAYLESLGAAHIDADAISRALTAEGGAALPAIRARFTDAVFHPDGTLDRATLAKRIFADAEEKRALEDILHPLILNEIRARIRRAESEGVPVCVLNVPLLFETGLDALCDAIWVMDVDAETQLERVMARGETRAQAQRRIASQMDAKERARRADRVISTAGTVADTREALRRAYAELCRE